MDDTLVNRPGKQCWNPAPGAVLDTRWRRGVAATLATASFRLRVCLKAGLKKVAADFQPAVEGGILPPGSGARTSKSPRFAWDRLCCGVFSAGLEARLYVSQDGRRYIFKQTLRRKPRPSSSSSFSSSVFWGFEDDDENEAEVGPHTIFRHALTRNADCGRRFFSRNHP